MCIYDLMFFPIIECLQQNCKYYLRYLAVSVSISMFLIVAAYLASKQIDIEILKFVVPSLIGLQVSTMVFPAIGYLNRREKVHVLETLNKALCDLEEKKNTISPEQYEKMKDSLLQLFRVTTGG